MFPPARPRKQALWGILGADRLRSGGGRSMNADRGPGGGESRAAGAGAPPGVALAGGVSARMGGADKALLQLGGRKLIARVVERLARQCAPVAINANADPARFAALGRPVLPDETQGGAGPLAGVLAAMDWTASLQARRVATVAADSPFFPEDLVARLSAAAGADRIAIAAAPDRTGRMRPRPLFALWPVRLRETLRDSMLMGEADIGFWAEAQGAVIVGFPPGPPDPFFGIDEPADLRRAETILAMGR